ncbi:IclR family transcriptional regulator [Halocatena halophila]|uniref:IclR family transcriptional regulator n=1 Tax=Halocatena halophila TaxID=2814576 RepID=UPI002ED08434
MTDRPTVKSARTTLTILNELRRRGSATVTELSESFELSTSSIHNYLNTLESEGYVVKSGNTYRVGLRFLSLGGHARHKTALYHAAKPHVRNLADQTGEQANLLVEEHGRGIYLQRAYGDDAVETDSYVGQRVYLHNTALGTAILAHLPSDRVEAIVDEHGLPATTEKTITDRNVLFERLERIRERGVAFDDEARVGGLRCVAVPIVNNDNTVEGAISVSGPRSRFVGDRYREVIPNRLKQAANIIELNVSYD